jgi:hypothetical protein
MHLRSRSGRAHDDDLGPTCPPHLVPQCRRQPDVVVSRERVVDVAACTDANGCKGSDKGSDEREIWVVWLDLSTNRDARKKLVPHTGLYVIRLMRLSRIHRVPRSDA